MRSASSSMAEAAQPPATAPDPSKGRLAFITPRFGDEVVGGSEAVMREAAVGLAGRGWQVDVLTTCARNHYTWRNEYPAGVTEVDGVRLHRFPVVRPRSTARRDRI